MLLLCLCGHQGRLNELMSVLRMQLLVPGARAEGKYAIDPLVFEDIKQVWLLLVAVVLGPLHVPHGYLPAPNTWGTGVRGETG